MKITRKPRAVVAVPVILAFVFSLSSCADILNGSGKVDTPTFDIASGTAVASGTTVSFACGTSGAVLSYSTDGTNYSVGTGYTINAAVTLKVKAIKDGMQDSSVVSATYTILAAGGSFDVSIAISKGVNFSSPGKSVFVLWAEDGLGSFIKNIYVSNAIATNVMASNLAFISRPQAVPYWTHKACIEDPYKDVAQKPDLYQSFMYLVLPKGQSGGPVPADLANDAVSGATPSDSFSKTTALTIPSNGTARILLEHNRSFDSNADFTADSLPADLETPLPDVFYDGSQSSLVWSLEISGDIQDGTYDMTIYGSGHPSGRNGKLYTAAYHTDAKDVVSSVNVTITRK